MFESVELLEREVKEFEQNILASTEFIKKLEGIIEAISKQERSFAVKTTELTSKIDSNADASAQLVSSMKLQVDAIQADHLELMRQLAEENKTNADQMFKLCQSIKRSINAKLLIVMSGVGVSIVLMVISFLMKY